MKYQLVLQVFFSVLSVNILDLLSLKIDWLRINKKCGFRFAQREFFKFFMIRY